MPWPIRNHMKKSDFVRIINNKPNTNFIATVISPWHALGVDVTIKYLESKGNVLSGFVFVYPTNTVDGKPVFSVNEKSFLELKDTIKIIYIDKEDREKHQKIKSFLNLLTCLKPSLRKTKNVYIANALNPQWMWTDVVFKALHKCKPIYVLFDEGAGSILMNSLKGQYRVHRLDCQLNDRNFNGVIFFFEFIFNKAFYSALYNNGMIINNVLIKHRNKHSSRDDEIKKFYYETFKEHSNNIEELAEYNNSVLINPQIKEDDYIESYDIANNIYKKISMFLKDKNNKLVIKPHPRDIDIDRFNEMNCFIDKRNKYTQEAIISSLSKNPICVISLSSTTLITLKTFFNIESISIAKMVYSDLREKKERENIKNYIDNFSNYVYMPNTEKELFDKLNEVLKENEK